jgi:hypothetical protein
MRRPALCAWIAILCAGWVQLLAPCPAIAAEPVGQLAAANDLVKGDGQKLSSGDSVFGGEQIETDATGQGQILFKDGTKFVVGKNSSVKLDAFVFDNSGNFSTFALSTVTGAFRWLSGKSKPTAYTIKTPTGALTVRGTAFDLYVLADGSTAVLLQAGQVQFCTTAGACQVLRRTCDYIVSKSGGAVSLPSRYSAATLQGQGFDNAFPYIANTGLLPQCQLTRSRCDKPIVPKVHRKPVSKSLHGPNRATSGTTHRTPPHQTQPHQTQPHRTQPTSASIAPQVFFFKITGNSQGQPNRPTTVQSVGAPPVAGPPAPKDHHHHHDHEGHDHKDHDHKDHDQGDGGDKGDHKDHGKGNGSGDQGDGGDKGDHKDHGKGNGANGSGDQGDGGDKGDHGKGGKQGQDHGTGGKQGQNDPLLEPSAPNLSTAFSAKGPIGATLTDGDCFLSTEPCKMALGEQILGQTIPPIVQITGLGLRHHMLSIWTQMFKTAHAVAKAQMHFSLPAPGDGHPIETTARWRGPPA